MIIELLGIPSCGKSTYSKRYIRENIGVINPLEIYLYNDSRVRQNLNKMILCATFMIFHPIKVFKITKKFNKVKFKNSSTQIKMFLYLFSTIEVCNMCRRKHKGKEIIIDEGIHQMIWGISYNAIDSKQSINDLYLELLSYVADEIRILLVPKEVLKERLLRRKALGGAELQRDILKNEALLEMSMNLLEDIASKVNQYEVARLKYIDFD